MQTLVVYDIPSDKLRNRVAEACKDYGLERIQWSAFRGDLNHNRRTELALRLRRTLGRSKGNIQLYPICDKDIGLRMEIGSESAVRRSSQEGERGQG
ncbi:MAG: CRISPR-associated endonuclease Cas2 [Bacillota bacterium]|nr:MAG: CRISPR-associated endonuclease Cas2 [Bacillota bacterium]